MLLFLVKVFSIWDIHTRMQFLTFRSFSDPCRAIIAKREGAGMARGKSSNSIKFKVSVYKLCFFGLGGAECNQLK